ncbi:hypothetical protein E2562_029354 [Oryza meyeriana var. granulata]|uniref:Uncharacterized protein n=1 Tax=Oryza meyeriana var. granulata TaxID=110450 RepID=A0A6G1C9F3_9ORYZ|nr:hypothetical protein E2562_029354 [Oryza meyeriana var. granulata]
MDAVTPPCFLVSTGLPIQSTSPDELPITFDLIFIGGLSGTRKRRTLRPMGKKPVDRTWRVQGE